ncbi:hypothetical protein U9M48_043914 [Paspalum notatum var. saurae]|uniref:Uncharacterized protein n=1 Tax=Paspalum notatum var. saurae TaxID=547442 RepID=A0AAQ3UTS1_PASNO
MSDERSPEPPPPPRPGASSRRRERTRSRSSSLRLCTTRRRRRKDLRRLPLHDPPPPPPPPPPGDTLTRSIATSPSSSTLLVRRRTQPNFPLSAFFFLLGKLKGCSSSAKTLEPSEQLCSYMSSSVHIGTDLFQYEHDAQKKWGHACNWIGFSSLKDLSR